MHVLSRLLHRSYKIINFIKYPSKINLKTFKPIKNKIGIFGLSCFGYCIGSAIYSNSFTIALCLSTNETSHNVKREDKRLTYMELWEPTYFDIIILILAVLSSIIAAIVNIQIPLKLGKVINVLSNLKDEKQNNFLNLLRVPSLELLFFYAIQALSTTSYISMLSIIGERLAASMKKRLFERIIIQDAEFFDIMRSGDLTNRITADVQDFKSSFKQCVSHGLRGVITIIGSTIALLLVSKELTAIVVVTIPSVVLLGSIMGRFLRILSKEAQIQNSKTAEITTEVISNVRTVKSFAMEDVEIEAFAKEVNYSWKLHSCLGIGIGIFQGLSNLAINGIVLGVLFSGGYMMNNGNLTPGDLMAFLLAAQSIQKSLATLSTLFGHLVKASASGARITEFLVLRDCATSPNLKDLRNRRLFTDKQYRRKEYPSSLEFRNVFFSYPTRAEQTVLKNFSLHIPAGSVVALCGESGAGKSTIAGLIQRLYDPISGMIMIDNTNIKNINVSDLRSNKIGVVSQQPQLFAKSIRDNIRYGKYEASDSEVEEAAKQAQAHDFIMEFENGYDTMVGERGGEALSGGQRQRIAIARAILKNPNILILDEATSALDSSSEILVQQALTNVMKGRTVIIIAHRLSTIQYANEIVVMKNGHIVETGTHSSLINKKGYYYELVQKLKEK